MIVSPDLARTAGVNVRRVDLAYLLLFALTIGIGLRYLGVLLMGALIIIPAVTAQTRCSQRATDAYAERDARGGCNSGWYGRGIVGAVEHRASDRSGRRGDVSAEPAPAARFRGTTTDASCRAPATTAARCASVTPDKQSVPSWLALDGAVLTAARDDTSTCIDGHTQAPLA